MEKRELKELVRPSIPQVHLAKVIILPDRDKDYKWYI